MSPRGHKFVLVPKGELTGVPAWLATPAQRERALPVPEARAILTALHRRSSSSLIELYELAVGVEANHARGRSMAAIVARIDDALARRTLLFIDESGAGALRVTAVRSDPQKLTADDELVEAVMAKRSTVLLDGRRYRVVTAASWLARPAVKPDAREREVDLQPLRGPAARAILQRTIDYGQTPSAERERWKKVLGRLWAEGGDDGIVLVRVAPVAGIITPTTDGDPVSPSQMRAKIAATTWIEVEIVFDDGTPYDGSCAIEIPGGRTITGPPDANGVQRLEMLEPGSCKVSFPDLDADAWAPG